MYGSYGIFLKRMGVMGYSLNVWELWYVPETMGTMVYSLNAWELWCIPYLG